MPKYIATLCVSIIAPSLPDAAKSLGLDRLEFDDDTDDIKTIHVDLQVHEIKE